MNPEQDAREIRAWMIYRTGFQPYLQEDAKPADTAST
jgi:hypothetical protein